MTILFLHGWRSVPGGVKPTFLQDHGHEVLNPKLPDDDFAEAVRIAQAEFDTHRPQAVVGSSRGGAVAMSIDSGEARLVLLCPAWKKYGTATTVKPDTVILHGRADDVVPFSDSEELAGDSGATLIEVGTDHRLADPEPLAAMLKACEGVDVTAEAATSELKSLASPAAARSAARFFKTGPGQYGEGDTFIGVSVPTLRTVARRFRALPPDEVESLLNPPVHEDRHLALLILVLQVAKCDDARRKAAFDFYLKNTRFVNNWDLVDCSAPQVVGGYLLDRLKQPLLKLARSTSLWERRIAVVSTQHFIRHGRFDDTLAVSRMLLLDDEDLIHKAAGWMLREVGKKDQAALEGFLKRYGGVLPRTKLRFAIERFPPDQRRTYLRGERSTTEGDTDAV